jgi:hypothetical protein
MGICQCGRWKKSALNWCQKVGTDPSERKYMGKLDNCREKWVGIGLVGGKRRDAVKLPGMNRFFNALPKRRSEGILQPQRQFELR